MKRALYRSADQSFEQQLATEAALQRDAGIGADFLEGVTAFLEKRPARFSGN